MSNSARPDNSAGFKNPLSRRSVLKAGAISAVAVGAAVAHEGLSTPTERRNVRLTASTPVATGFAAGSQILYMSSTDRSKTLDIAQGGRATWIRFDVPWHFVQPTNSTSYTWDFVDATLNDCVARGLKILVSVVGCPAWAAYTTSSTQSRPASATTYAAFCKAVATRYKGKINAIEIWNEPNGRLFFQPNPDAAFYTAMLKAAYASIKATDSSISVIAGALGPVTNGDGLVMATDFVNTMYANGAQGSFDALSYHPYDYANTFANSMYYDTSPTRQMISLHSMMKNVGDGGKKIWITEYGAPTTLLTQDQQYDLIFNSMRQWQEVSYAGPMLIYTLRDTNSNGSSDEDRFGVATSSYVPKKALYGIEALVRLGFPPREEATAFAASPDASLGASVGPIYPMTRGFAYEFENGARYATYNGFFSSPPAVAAVARNYRYVPVAPFANDYQDFDAPGGFRVFSRPATTGTHAIYAAILTAWKANLGFPITDQTTTNGVASVKFEHGTITWSQAGGTKVTYS